MKLSELSADTSLAPTETLPKVKLSDVQKVEPKVKLSDIAPKEPEDPGFFGTFHPIQSFFKEGAIPHIFQGLFRLSGHSFTPPTPEERVKAEEFFRSVKDNPHSIADMVGQLATFAKDHPGQFLGEFANSIFADPELLAIPAGGVFKSGQRLGKAMGTLGAKAGPEAGRAMGATGRVLGAGAEGALTNVAIEGASQFATGEASLEDFKGPANFGAAMGAGGAMLGLRIPGAKTASRLAGKLFGKKPEVPVRGQLNPATEAEAVAQAAARDAENVKAMGNLGPGDDIFGAPPGAPMEPAPKVPVGMKRLYTAGDPTNTWFTDRLADAKKWGTPVYVDVLDKGYRPPDDFKPLKGKPGMFQAERPIDTSKLKPMEQPRKAISDMVKTHTPEPLADRMKAVAKTALAGGAVGAGAGIAAQGLGGIDSGEWPYGALTGAVIGSVPRLLTAISPRRGHDIGEAQSRLVGEASVYARAKGNGIRAFNELVPVAEDRAKVFMALATGTIGTLPPKLKEAAQAFEKAYAAFGQKALEAGELSHLRENYAPRLVESTIPGVDIGNIFSAGTKFATFQEFAAAIAKTPGLRIKTMDAGEVFSIYSDAMHATLMNRRLIEALKDVRMADGSALLVPKASRGPHYVESPSSRLEKYAVHRDIAGQLQMVFDAKGPEGLGKALQGFNAATKNLTVMGSLFHAKTLLDGWIGAMAWTKPGTKRLSGEVLRPGAGIDAGIDAFRKVGPKTKEVDDLLRSGMMVGQIDDTQAHALNDMMAGISRTVDRVLPFKTSSAEAFKSAQDFNTGLHKFTFDFAQTGWKVRTALAAHEHLLAKGYTYEQSIKAASTFVNDIYGGQNWVNLANSAQSDIMHRLATKLASPSGRRISQLALFAPDWTISTFRAAYMAMPGVAGSPELASLYRNYMVKSSITYLALANAINYAATGRSIFENKDPTKVSLGNGISLPISKHFLEFFNWLKNPVQEAANKMAFFPKAATQVISQKQWAGPNAPDIHPWAIPWAATVATVAKGGVPITMQELFKGIDPGKMAAGFLGFPITGAQPEAKAVAKSENKGYRKDAIRIRKLQREVD